MELTLLQRLMASASIPMSPDDGTGAGANVGGGDAGGGATASSGPPTFDAFDDWMNNQGNPPPPAQSPNANRGNTQQPGNQGGGGLPPQGAQQTGQQPGAQGNAPQPPAAPQPLAPPPADIFQLPGQGAGANLPPEQRVAQLENQLASLIGFIQGGGNQQQRAEAQPQQPQRPANGLLYNSTVHPDVLAALNSDDPSRQAGALAYALNVQATEVHRNLAREVGGYLRDTLVPNLLNHLKQEREQRDYESSVRNHFYSNHRDLDHEPYRVMVQHIAGQMIQHAMSNNAWRGWTHEFAEAVANNTRRLIGQRPPNANGNGNGNGGAPSFTPSGSRPGGLNTGSNSDPNSPESIADLIGDIGFG